MASWSKERNTQFIEFYRSQECLWTVKSKDYSNRMKREKAYEEMRHFFNTFYPGANKDPVVSKISYLRGSWWKENKKMISSQTSGAGGYEIHKPSLFYLDALSLIADSENPRKGRDIIDLISSPVFHFREPDKVNILCSFEL